MATTLDTAQLNPDKKGALRKRCAFCYADVCGRPGTGDPTMKDAAFAKTGDPTMKDAAFAKTGDPAVKDGRLYKLPETGKRFLCVLHRKTSVLVSVSTILHSDEKRR